MFNARKILPAAIAALALCASCSDNNGRIEEARRLLGNARELVAAHKYDSAIVVLDTLDKKYRDCLDVRREGTTVRLGALSDLTRDSLASAELQLKSTNAELEELAPRFKKIDLEGTEGYYVDKDIFTGTEMNRTCLQMRVDDEGYCFLIANAAGKPIGLNSLRMGDVATAPSQSVAMGGSEIMSLSQETASPLVEAMWNATPPVTVELVGTKGHTSVKLDSKQLAAFRNTWTYGRSLQRSRKLSITLEKLERQLAKLNDQLASQIKVDEESADK